MAILFLISFNRLIELEFSRNPKSADPDDKWVKVFKKGLTGNI
jgi:hypothetical protein